MKYWRFDLVNDFESYVIKNHPELRGIKDQLYSLGADYAAMSGSGSSFLVFFQVQYHIRIGHLNTLFGNQYFSSFLSEINK